MSGPSASRPDPGPRQPAPASAGRTFPDPWGVRRAENLLTSLEGVLSARVVTTPLGEVSEIHVLAQAGLPAKQLVRNVESALLAHLGLRVDHRKISIAQTAEVKPLETLEQGGGPREVADAERAVREYPGDAGPAARAVPGAGIAELSRGPRGGGGGGAGHPAGAGGGGGEGDGGGAGPMGGERGAGAGHAPSRSSSIDRQLVFVAVLAVNGRESLVLTGTAEPKGTWSGRRCWRYWMRPTGGRRRAGRRRIEAKD